MQQHTLREPLEFEGIGLHTGEQARVRLEPRAVDGGITFRLAGGIEFPAVSEYVVETERATVLGYAGKTVSTVEHLLSAISGMEVDNVSIDVDGPEIPALDGSASVFAEGIARAGRVAQGAPRAAFRIDAPRWYCDGSAMLAFFPADALRIRFIVDFAPPIGAQYYDGEIDPQRYRSQIAPSRTFGFLHEIEALLERGLARGGTLENALVFKPEGPMTPLRSPDEVVTHKVLDLIGDLALLGARPECDVVAIKSGHRLHAHATRDLRAQAGILDAVVR